MKKVALFAFNGDAMCFVHVLLNGLDMKANDTMSRSSSKVRLSG